MPRSAPVDGFRLSYDRVGAGRPVVLLHGWPGDRSDFRRVVPLLSGTCDVVVPDLRGFGASDKHGPHRAEQYSAAAQARSVIGLVEELGLERPVVAGYDVGAGVALEAARARPDLVRALVLPPVRIPAHIVEPSAQPVFWYQWFHRLGLAEELLDGKPAAVRDYLRHFWSHWSGPSFALDDGALDHLVSVYGAPGAFTASIAWYRASSAATSVVMRETPPARQEPITVPTTVLQPEHDPILPRTRPLQLDDYFEDATLELADGIGHFLPVEGPDRFARAIERAFANPDERRSGGTSAKP
ncbi:alpha/beta fold hydrolase [Streptomyces abikoensis]|uniref:alpha/beta fold hydrolase n=1 Tax=Streptomyces abikoensis TaxID=97398 RepID=UPI0036C70628